MKDYLAESINENITNSKYNIFVIMLFKNWFNEFGLMNKKQAGIIIKTLDALNNNEFILDKNFLKYFKLK